MNRKGAKGRKRECTKEREREREINMERDKERES